MDFGYEIPGLARYRCFLCRETGWARFSGRFPTICKGCEQLGLPPVIAKLASLLRGLSLCGPTGRK
ncbi:MAG: hypothetical protein R2860_08975 [Desulfobacterales bacterium]